jgi:hypothetical protein
MNKAIRVTSRGGPYGCETSRLPHFLDNRLTDGAEVVSLTRRPSAPYPQEDSWYSFLLEVEAPMEIVRLGSIEKSHEIGIRTRDLPVRSIVPQPITLPRSPFVLLKIMNYRNDTLWHRFWMWKYIGNFP